MYEHLNVEKRELRLLIIDHSLFLSTPPQCDLRQVSLSNCESFMALSYVWGDEGNTVELKINGHSYYVTPNLISALQHLSKMAARLVIWVDAICINQGDLRERSGQVRMMADIYKNAEHVLVWLGPAGGESDLGLNIIQDLGNAYYDYKSSEKAIQSIQEKYASIQDQAWTSISQLLRRPWWCRLWTVQEVVLGRQVSLICGTQSISWNAMYHTYQVLQNIDAISNSTFRSFISHRDVMVAVRNTHVAAKLQISHAVKLRKPMEQLLFVASHCRTFKATDPRDKIYACMGLGQPLPGLEIDYMSPFHQTYTNFVTKHIAYTKKLGVLREAGLGISARDVGGLLPTWVPDWRFERLSSPLYRSLYQTSGESKVCASISSGKLSVSGILFDQVEDIALDEHKWLSLALHNQPTIYEPLRIPQFQAYFRTIMTDLNPFTGTQLNPKYTSFYDPAVHFVAMIGATQTKALPHYMSKFAEEIRKPLEQSLLPQLLQQDDPEVSRAYWEWEAEEPQAVQGIIAKPKPKLLTYFQHVSSLHGGRSFIMTSGGYMGLAPNGTQHGDHVCILLGSDVPLVLRKANDTDDYMLIGECFILGMMQGELLNDRDLENKSETINII